MAGNKNYRTYREEVSRRVDALPDVTVAGNAHHDGNDDVHNDDDDVHDGDEHDDDDNDSAVLTISLSVLSKCCCCISCNICRSGGS